MPRLPSPPIDKAIMVVYRKIFRTVHVTCAVLCAMYSTQSYTDLQTVIISELGLLV